MLLSKHFGRTDLLLQVFVEMGNLQGHSIWMQCIIFYCRLFRSRVQVKNVSYFFFFITFLFADKSLFRSEVDQPNIIPYLIPPGIWPSSLRATRVQIMQMLGMLAIFDFINSHWPFNMETTTEAKVKHLVSWDLKVSNLLTPHIRLVI